MSLGQIGTGLLSLMGQSIWQPPSWPHFAKSEPLCERYNLRPFLDPKPLDGYCHRLYGIREPYTHTLNDLELQNKLMRVFQEATVTLRPPPGISCSDRLYVNDEPAGVVVKTGDCNQVNSAVDGFGALAAQAIFEGFPGLKIPSIAAMYVGPFTEQHYDNWDGGVLPPMNQLPSSRYIHEGTPDNGAVLFTALEERDPLIKPFEKAERFPSSFPLIDGRTAQVSHRAMEALLLYRVLGGKDTHTDNVFAKVNQETGEIDEITVVDNDEYLDPLNLCRPPLNFFENPRVFAKRLEHPLLAADEWSTDYLTPEWRKALQNHRTTPERRDWLLTADIPRRLQSLLEFDNANPAVTRVAFLYYLFLKDGVFESVPFIDVYDGLNRNIALLVPKALENMQKQIQKGPLKKRFEKYSAYLRDHPGLRYNVTKEAIEYSGLTPAEDEELWALFIRELERVLN